MCYFVQTESEGGRGKNFGKDKKQTKQQNQTDSINYKKGFSVVECTTASCRTLQLQHNTRSYTQFRHSKRRWWCFCSSSAFAFYSVSVLGGKRGSGNCRLPDGGGGSGRQTVTSSLGSDIFLWQSHNVTTNERTRSARSTSTHIVDRDMAFCCCWRRTHVFILCLCRMEDRNRIIHRRIEIYLWTKFVTDIQ